MDELTKEIEAYDKMRLDLEAKHMGKWVIVYHQELIALHDDFQQAAQDAVARFSERSYLLRQIGARPVTLPASVMFKVGHA